MSFLAMQQDKKRSKEKNALRNIADIREGVNHSLGVVERYYRPVEGKRQ